MPCIGKRNTLSVCMIVKNEEANIARAIQSFLPFADEIVVNDTGSTDKTIEIVESFPKTVLMTSEWVGDFSYSRNLSLKKATCSWVVWMDADDYVPPDQAEAFNKLKLMPLDKMIAFTILNTVEGGKPTGMRFLQSRMFPNNPNIRFEGLVHESMVKSAAEVGLHPINTNTIIWHTGYESPKLLKEKAQRDLDLLLSDPEYEEKIEGLIEFGDAYAILEEKEKAVEYYRRASEFKNCTPSQLDLKMNAMNKCARYLSEIGKIDEAKEVYNKCLEHFPRNDDSYYGLAVILVAENKKEEAMQYFRKLLTLKANVTIGGSNYVAIKQDALKNLSLFEFDKGNFKLSRNYAEEMLKNEPNNQDAKWLFDRANAALLSAKDKRPLLSLCMIVKNEEKNIGECLKSVQGLADEIVVTDTGSSDKTIEIAESFGAKIEHFKWIKDFSAARNYSFSKASSRWIIWLDADDRLPQKTVIELRKKLEQESPNKVFSLVVCNSTDGGKTGSKFFQVRIFPNKAQIKFEGRIHEQILPSIRKLGFQEVNLPLEVFHTGYEDRAFLKEKQLRNLEIFREQFPNEKGMNPLDMYQYGIAYEILEDNENALKWLKEASNTAEKQGYNELLVLSPYDIARILERQGNLPGALESLDLSLKENSQFEPAILRKARILSMLGQSQEAIKWFGYSASIIPKTSFLPSNTANTHADSLKFLADYWKETDTLQIALDILKTLKNLLLGTPHNPLALAEIYVAQNKAAEALDNLEFLKKDLKNKPEFAFLYGQALALTGDVPNAIKIVGEAKKKFPQDQNIAELAKVMGV